VGFVQEIDFLLVVLEAAELGALRSLLVEDDKKARQASSGRSTRSPGFSSHVTSPGGTGGTGRIDLSSNSSDNDEAMQTLGKDVLKNRIDKMMDALEKRITFNDSKSSPSSSDLNLQEEEVQVSRTRKIQWDHKLHFLSDIAR
jgi:hypothetical protein